MEGATDRWIMRKLNGSASVWPELKGNAMRRPRLVKRLMAPTNGKARKLRNAPGLKRGPAFAKREKESAGPRYGRWS
jgi:hypothetical protein